jgi:hypothetical protein
MFGSAATSMILADFDTILSQTSFSFATPAPNVLVLESFRRVIPVAEVAVGVNWRRGPWFAAAGWELSHWGNYVDSLDFPLADQPGRSIRKLRDLSFDGWFVRGGVIW